MYKHSKQIKSQLLEPDEDIRQFDLPLKKWATTYKDWAGLEDTARSVISQQRRARNTVASSSSDVAEGVAQDTSAESDMSLVFSRTLERNVHFEVLEADVLEEWKPREINLPPTLVIADVPYGITNDKWDTVWKKNVYVTNLLCFIMLLIN